MMLPARCTHYAIFATPAAVSFRRHRETCSFAAFTPRRSFYADDTAITPLR
jgi:hypothetical protein